MKVKVNKFEKVKVTTSKKKSHLSLPIKVRQFLFNFLLRLFHLTLTHSPSFPQHLQGKRKHDRRTGVVRDLPLRKKYRTLGNLQILGNTLV